MFQKSLNEQQNDVIIKAQQLYNNVKIKLITKILEYIFYII